MAAVIPAFAQAPERHVVSTRDVFLISAIPVALVGAVSWVNGNSYAKQVQKYDDIMGVLNSTEQEARDQAASYRNQFRVIAAMCGVYCVTALIVKSSEPKRQPSTTQITPWACPIQHAAGFTATVRL
jgi:hypothetical protein